MPSSSLAFPRSSTPGALPGEGEGVLLNAYIEKAGDTVYVRRVAGSSVFATTTLTGCRGLLDVSGTVYAAFSGTVVSISPTGTVTTIGALPGTDPVTFARNNKVTGGVSTPDIVVVRSSGGVYLIDPVAGTIVAYPDTNVQALAITVDFLGGYFLFATPDGRMFASGLNDVWVSDSDHTQNALSFATAEASADGLVRGFVASGRFYAMGTETIEPWLNVGNTPFPLARATSIIPVGLLAAMAVAGSGEGWDRNPIFVAHDGTVREIQGYSTAIISTPDVERFIAASTVSTLEACVYTSRGKAVWVLSSDQGTWEYEVNSQTWRQRVSAGATRWRGTRSVKSNGRWLVGDVLSGNVLAIGDALRTESGQPIAWTVESTPARQFPLRTTISGVYLYFTPCSANVAVSWSHDGGTTWSIPVTRPMSAARDGVRVGPLGTSSHHGLRLRLTSSDDVEFSFLGAAIEAEGRAP